MKGDEVANEHVHVRPALEDDVGAVRDLFAEAYGDDYPFTQFYDPQWLKKAVFDDDTLFLVGEVDGVVAGTASAVFTSGSLSDLIGEFGRLVVGVKARGHGLGMTLFKEAIGGCAERIHFGFAEARTAHDGTQKICDRTGFAAIGFEPLKYALADRESVVLYARLRGRGLELRRNNPRVIPEAAALAMHALDAMGLPGDAIVTEDGTERKGEPCTSGIGSGSAFYHGFLRCGGHRTKDPMVVCAEALVMGWGSQEELYLMASCACVRRADEWVTEWVSRHVVVTCYRVLSDLSTTCNPRFRLKNAI